MKNTAVFGIYASRSAVESAVMDFRNSGFRATDISVLMPENLGTKDLGAEKNTKSPEGAATGATTGAVVGGVLGWLAGIGALAIPGLGPFIAAGPIIGALAGLGAGGSAIGGLTGALVGMGIPEYEAKRYVEGRIKTGGILLSPYIATIPSGPIARRRSWRPRALKTSAPPPKQAPITRLAKSRCVVKLERKLESSTEWGLARRRSPLDPQS